MQHEKENEALVRRFHAAGKRLASKPEYTDQEMCTVDQAQVQRLEALQELADRLTLGGAAALLGMTVRQVQDELRVNRALE